MANHQSSKKRIRQDDKKRLENKYYAKTMRNALKQLRAATEKEAAVAELPKVTSMIDRLAKKNIIHRNKAANLKASIASHVNKL
ncbi:30S ribosomal protein S20 [Mangrovibacterium lignilyticum]|uniref:30S ribosomal protein S20 n=1 Tax=Mangrovibacterium lignilyticum TaxID=2668052 RepID=UPI0013D225F7|nr:30S ribosomal protein S20 [Mangrovibacterium lignilyticum]